MPTYSGLFRLPYAASTIPHGYQRSAVVVNGRLYTPYVDNSGDDGIVSLLSTIDLENYVEHAEYENPAGKILKLGIASDAELAESEGAVRILFVSDGQYLRHVSFDLSQGWGHAGYIGVGSITGFRFASAVDGSFLRALSSATNTGKLFYASYDCEAEAWGSVYTLFDSGATEDVGLAVFSGQVLALFHSGSGSTFYFRGGKISGDPPAFTEGWYVSRQNNTHEGNLVVTPSLAYCFHNDCLTDGTRFDVYPKWYNGSSWAWGSRIYTGGCGIPSGLWAGGILRVFIPVFAGGAKTGNLQYLYMMENDGSGWGEPELLFDGEEYDGGGWYIRSSGFTSTYGNTFPVSTTGGGWGTTFRVYNGSEHRLLLYADGLKLGSPNWVTFKTSGKPPTT